MTTTATFEPRPDYAGIPARLSGDHAVIELEGELDLATAPRLEMALAELRRQGATTIDVDVSAVSFMDSQPLRIFLRHDAELSMRGGQLRLHHPSPQVTRLLAVTRTTHLLSAEAPAYASQAA